MTWRYTLARFWLQIATVLRRLTRTFHLTATCQSVKLLSSLKPPPPPPHKEYSVNHTINALFLLPVNSNFQQMVPATTSYWRAIISRIQGKLSWGRGTTAPQMSTYAATAHRMNLLHKLETGLKHMNGEFTPVAAALGMILVAASLGLYTARHQLLYAPNVSVDKRRRETIAEVKEPDGVTQTSSAFFSNSFFRRLAHLQGPRRGQVLPDPIRGDPFA